MPDLEDVARRLYAGPLEDFVARRTALAKELKGNDPELARQVKALPKPTAAGAALNAFGRSAAPELDALLAHGEQLRSTTDREQARELSAATPKVVAQAVAALRRAAPEVDAAVAEQALRAALADPAAAAVLEAGLLLRPFAASGFGPVELEGTAALVPSGAPRPRARLAAVAAPAEPRRQATKSEGDDREALRSALRESESALTAADQQLRAAEQDALGATQALDSARAALALAETQAKEADRARRTAERAREQAARKRDRAERRLQS